MSSQEFNLENLSNKDLLDNLNNILELKEPLKFSNFGLNIQVNNKKRLKIIIPIIEERIKDLVSSNEKLILENNNLKQNINREKVNNLNQKNVLEDEILKLKDIITYLLNLEKNKKRKLEDI